MKSFAVAHLLAGAAAACQLVILALTLTLAPAAHADPAAGCSNPSWAPQPMPGFAIDSCTSKAWASDSYELTSDNKTLGGARNTVEYALKDPASNPSADATRDYFIAAGKKAGATLMSDPANDWEATLKQTTPAGEFWYHYQHGSGSDTETDSYTLTTWKIEPPRQEVVAKLPQGSLADMPNQGCSNPPWLVKQFDYFKLADCSKRDIDSITLDLPDGEKVLAGHFLDVNYALTDPERDPTELYVYRNYVNALEKIGAKLVSDPSDATQAVLTQTTPQGQFWYIYKHGSGNDDSTETYALTTLQMGGPPPKTCKMEVYGVNFDFNKSAIKPDSDPVLKQLLALFATDPSYSAEIGGHTDNVGTRTYNMKLSGERADAVKGWLVAHGVDTKRMTTRGYADTMPLVPNDTDAHRARNRRVELKKADCAG